MKKAGSDPNYIVGADIPQLSDSSGVGSGKHFIAEACEYDRSFVNLRPAIAVILNIEADHLDYYSGIDDIIDAFVDFSNGAKDGATVICNGGDDNVGKLIKRLNPDKKVVTKPDCAI